MIKFLFILFMFFMVSGVIAQKDETLLQVNDIEHGGYGALTIKFSGINDKLGVLVGGYGGWLINHSFMIGAGGFGLANKIEADPEIQALSADGKILDVQFGYGGFIMEYIHNPHRLFHYNIKALIGAGGVGYAVRDDFNASDSKQSACFVLELDANVEMNVTDFMRVNVGAGYRYVSGSDLEGIRDNDLAGPSANIIFKFGKF